MRRPARPLLAYFRRAEAVVTSPLLGDERTSPGRPLTSGSDPGCV